MDINVFVKEFSEELEDIVASELTPDTSYTDLPEWSSLCGLSVSSMIYANYQVNITLREILSMKSIRELFERVEQRRNEAEL